MAAVLDIVGAMMDAMAVKDYDRACALFTEDCQYTNVPLATVRGPAGVRAVLEPFFAPTIENEFLTLRALADGRLAFVERRDRHRLASGWVELPVTGVFEVSDGRISLWRDYFDRDMLLRRWPQPAAG